jgi:hypothetical protein
MSEYGCITNGRNFQEVASLYSTSMSSVFSGGLVYEFSQEGNGYGLVTISGNTVTPNSQFTALENAYKATSNPSGSGGATTSSKASTCPPESAQWNVANDDLPAMPAAAQTFLKNGAGPGPGLNGPGSQAAGDSENESAGTATAGSGAVTQTGSSSKATGSSAASSLHLDLAFMGVVSLSLAVGNVLL